MGKIHHHSFWPTFIVNYFMFVTFITRQVQLFIENNSSVDLLLLLWLSRPVIIIDQAICYSIIIVQSTCSSLLLFSRPLTFSGQPRYVNIQ